METAAQKHPAAPVMKSRGVVARELDALDPGGILLVPFKYCSANNIKVSVSNLNKEGTKQFAYDNSDDTYSVIRRVK